MEVIERLWQRLPRPLRFPIRAAIHTLQRRSGYRRWMARQMEQGGIDCQIVEHDQEWACRMYALHVPVDSIYRVTLTRKQQVIAEGDLLLLPPSHAPAAWLLGIWVHPLFRRGSVGLYVVQTLLQLAQDHQVREVALSVEMSNIPALQLYEKLGFQAHNALTPPTQEDIAQQHMLLVL